MKEENFTAAKNTKNGVVNIPLNVGGYTGRNSSKGGVRLGEVDCRC